VLYRRALRLFKQSNDNPNQARQVVRYGRRVLEGSADSRDAAIVSVRDAVASAAAMIWRAEQNREMRDLAIKIDGEQLESGQRTASSLRRLGELIESAGDKGKALSAWRELLNGVQSGTPEWYEARYESLRLLFDVTPSEALDAMKQHKVLHPEFGPEPWGAKLRELDSKMRAVAPPTPPATGSTPSTPAKGGGG
jgi:hypothetical protein